MKPHEVPPGLAPASPARRGAVLVVAAAVVTLAACTATPVARDADAGPTVPAVRPWRTIAGAFLSPPPGPAGVPVRPGTGVFVKLLSPAAVALRDGELLVVDPAAGRTYRIDTDFGTMSAIPGAPTAPGTAVALAADRSAWLLDPQARQVLRFARDARLLQTFRAPAGALSPRSFALLDDGAGLVMADASQAGLVEFRAAASFGVALPRDDTDRAVSGIAGVAPARDGWFVLDALSGVVHRLQRDGRRVASLGAGVLKQPVAIASDPRDRAGRVFVIDAQDRAVKVLRDGAGPTVLDAATLGVQRIGGIAVDGTRLAVSDSVAGQVVIVTVPAGVVP